MNLNAKLVAAAATGILLGAGGCAKTQDTNASSPSAGDMPASSASTVMDSSKHGCKGQNACKGQGGCSVAGKHACKGQNDCKGQGGCKST